MRLMRFHQTLALIAGTVVVPAASVGSLWAQSSNAPSTCGHGRVVLHVLNDTDVDQRILVMTGGHAVNLGLLEGGDAANFDVPVYAMCSPAQLVVNPEGEGVAYPLGKVTLTPGERVDFTIEKDLSESQISID